MSGIYQRWKTRPLREEVLEWLRPLWCTPPAPDPWPPDVEDAIQAPDAVEVCHHCFAPTADSRWFCPQCGAAVGPYNNWMNYVYIFSIGEVLRSGVGPEARYSSLTAPGYIVIGLLQYGLFSPFYFVRLFLNWRRLSKAGAEPPGGQGIQAARPDT